MMFRTVVVMRLLVGSALLGACSPRPLEAEDYRQYQQNTGGNSYTPQLLSPAGTFGSSQTGFSSLANPAGMFLPQSIPQSSLNSFNNPFGAGQTYGASSYAGPGGYPAGIPNYFG